MKKCKYCGGIIEISEAEIKEQHVTDLRNTLKAVTQSSSELSLCQACFEKIGRHYFETHWFG